MNNTCRICPGVPASWHKTLTATRRSRWRQGHKRVFLVSQVDEYQIITAERGGEG